MGKLYSEEDVKRVIKQKVEPSEIVNQKMEEAYCMIRQQEERRGKKRPFRKLILVAATLSLFGAMSLAVLAASGFFQKEVVEEADTINYKFELDYALSPNVFDVIPEYIPAEYTTEFATNKFCKEDEYGLGISIFAMTTADLDQINNEISVTEIEKVEKTTFNGLEAHVITTKDAEKYKRGNMIFIFNPEEGYVLQVFGYYTLPIEELKKVAEHVKVEKSQDETAAFYAEEGKGDLAAANEEANKIVQKEKEEGIGEERIKHMGTEVKGPKFDDAGMDAEGFADHKISYTVKDAKYVDSVSEYPQENFYNYEEEVLPNLNVDGTLRPHLRSTLDGEGKIIGEETVQSKFLVVEIQVKNYSDQVVDTALYRMWERLEKRDDGRYNTDNKWDYMAVPSENWFLNDHPIYLSNPQYVEGIERMKHFFFKDLQPGETLEYTLIYAIDEDMVGDVFLVHDEWETDKQYFSLEK